MQRAVSRKPVRGSAAAGPAAPSAWRDRLAVLLGLVTVLCVGLVFILAKGTHFLMPGPLSSAHGAIENCSTCHTKSGSDKLSWPHGLIAGDPIADGKACISCHSMPDTAFNAHGASIEVLNRSTERLSKIAAQTPAPLSARLQSATFSTGETGARGRSCAACHQEHQGANLGKISNEQCRTCHVVKFDSFDGDHPTFENYPFKKRTPIIYDHAGHFTKHFPEVAKKDPARRVPESCSSCHNSRQDKRVMAVAPFEQTCAACHQDQITGKERASGPKGIAFLSLPGLDLQTLKKKNAAIGEWPASSEAGLTPFMKVMISRNARGRSLIKAVESLDLQDLSRANNAQIKAVTDLVWEIKRLFYALITGKASDALGDLGIGGGAKLSASLVADLTASIPRDVVMGAQQQWLPNLGTEVTGRTEGRDAEPGGWITTVAGSAVDSEGAATEEAIRPAPADQQAPAKSAPETSATEAGGRDKSATAASTADARPPPKGGDQTDDLLHPTEQEVREMATLVKGDAKASEAKGSAKGTVTEGAATAPATRADASPPASRDAPAARPQARAAPVISIESNIDPENWAEYGGWYRQDYGIFYRPTGHKDKFIYSWLFLTGPKAPKGGKTPTAAVFNALTNKDAQGSCTKCHSVDEIQSKGRVVNFSPPSVESRQGRFTHFIHEPHFGIMADRGCLTCHSVEKDRPYLKSYEQGNAKSFASNFGTVKKELCQTCHNSSMARQDCLTCHKYHVNGALRPITNTKIPTE
jgi:hypothetical protein